MIVLHYTGMLFSHEAIHRLCDTKARVSSHYVVLESGSIVQLVQEAKRAWHAGVSSWAGDPDINSRSIGIEICNPGHEFGYPDFPSRQIAATTTLCRSILTRNIVRPENILAHSDVAPARKQDPGEKFPWKRLAQSGVGLWVEAGAVNDATAQPRRQRRQGHRIAADALRIRLRHRHDRPLRHHHLRGGHRVPAAFPSGPGRRHRRRRDGADPAEAADRPRCPAAEEGGTGEARGARRQPRGEAGPAAPSRQLPRPSRRQPSRSQPTVRLRPASNPPPSRSRPPRNRASCGACGRPLDADRAPPHPYPVSRPGGRSGNHRKVAGEESPGSRTNGAG